MDYNRVLIEFYTDKDYHCENTYESLVWMEETPKPTDKELCDLYETIKDEWSIFDMKTQRNMLLASSDFRVVSDYPNRDKWLVYRQELRDLPNNWTGTYPEEPTE